MRINWSEDVFLSKENEKEIKEKGIEILFFTDYDLGEETILIGHTVTIVQPGYILL